MRSAVVCNSLPENLKVDIEQMTAIQRTRLWGKGALHFASVLNDERIYQTCLGGTGPMY
jgi:hypothetical protein